MMNDERSSYRWQDHVMAPQRTALNLLATVLIVAVVGTASVVAGHHDPAPVTHTRIATEQASSLAQSVKRPVSLTHSRMWMLNGC